MPNLEIDPSEEEFKREKSFNFSFGAPRPLFPLSDQEAKPPDTVYGVPLDNYQEMQKQLEQARDMRNPAKDVRSSFWNTIVSSRILLAQKKHRGGDNRRDDEPRDNPKARHGKHIANLAALALNSGDPTDYQKARGPI